MWRQLQLQLRLPISGNKSPPLSPIRLPDLTNIPITYTSELQYLITKANTQLPNLKSPRRFAHRITTIVAELTKHLTTLSYEGLTTDTRDRVEYTRSLLTQKLWALIETQTSPRLTILTDSPADKYAYDLALWQTPARQVKACERMLTDFPTSHLYRKMWADITLVKTLTDIDKLYLFKLNLTVNNVLGSGRFSDCILDFVNQPNIHQAYVDFYDSIVSITQAKDYCDTIEAYIEVATVTKQYGEFIFKILTTCSTSESGDTGTYTNVHFLRQTICALWLE